MGDGKLVYSTDPKLNIKCPKCKELKPSCTCPPDVALKSFNFFAKLSIEKSGRAGKTVTVIDGLPKINIFLKLCLSKTLLILQRPLYLKIFG